MSICTPLPIITKPDKLLVMIVADSYNNIVISLSRSRSASVLIKHALPSSPHVNCNGIIVAWGTYINVWTVIVFCVSTVVSGCSTRGISNWFVGHYVSFDFSLHGATVIHDARY